MKKNYIILSVIVLSAGVFSFQKNEETSKISKLHILNSTGKNGLFAGAPGDANCTQCHGGTAQSGSSVNTLTIASGITPVSSYIAGSTYNVALTMSGNPLRTGFQAVAMNSSNAMVGTIAAVSGTQILTPGRVTHTSSTPVNWVWTWTAPGTDVGDVTFYVATLSGQGATNQTGGDIVYLSQTVLASPSANLLEKLSDKYNFTAGYSSSSNSVVMDFNSLVSGEMYFNLVDMNGRSVFTYGPGQSVIGKNSEKIVLPEDLKNGMYVVNMFVNNNVMEKKIMIQK
jgi:hypothetical protein